MTHEVVVQIACEEEELPDPGNLRVWARAAVGEQRENTELTIRVVDETEIAQLNERYRKKRGVTNVLSFPFDAPAAVDIPLLGDVVICAPVVRREADEQSKNVNAHWAHMVVHGTLHLLGFDHEKPAQAREMEALETRILADLGFDNPYEVRGSS